MTQNTLTIYTLKELVEMKVLSIPYLWQDILPKSEVCILTGPSDSNKSTITRQFGYAIINKDETFLGRRLHVNKGRVLIIATEDGQYTTAAIVRKQNAHNLTQAVQQNLLFHFKPIKDIRELDNILQANPVDLVILDTWTDNFYGDLNSAVSVRANLGAYSQLADKHKCCILCIHHVNKKSEGKDASKQSLVGSQGIESFARVVLDLRRNKVNKRELKIVKGNYIPDELKNKPIILDLNVQNMMLSLSDEQGGYGFEQSRISETSKGKFYEAVTELVTGKDEYTQDEIVKYLEDTFPDEKTPSKGTVNGWIREIRVSQSKNDSISGE